MDGKVYAGIGSRSTPGHILVIMQQLATRLATLGWVLRSGNCCGADQAFQGGANQVDPKLVELYLPWPGYEAEHIAVGNGVYTPCSLAYRIAAEYHPAWDKCSHGARAMHARNVQIVLGTELDRPVDLVICWTPGGKAVGGTAMGIRLAQAHRIPVYNLAKFCGLEPVYANAGQMCFEF
jgi:hypothetical protein